MPHHSEKFLVAIPLILTIVTVVSLIFSRPQYANLSNSTPPTPVVKWPPTHTTSPTKPSSRPSIIPAPTPHIQELISRNSPDNNYQITMTKQWFAEPKCTLYVHKLNNISRPLLGRKVDCVHDMVIDQQQQAHANWLSNTKFFFYNPINQEIAFFSISNNEITWTSRSLPKNSWIVGYSQKQDIFIWNNSSQKEHYLTSTSLTKIRSLPELSGKKYGQVLFDELNNGLILIKTNRFPYNPSEKDAPTPDNRSDFDCQGDINKCEVTWTEFGFYDLSSATYTSLITTEKVMAFAFGRGCGGNYISKSQIGKISLRLDCISIPEEYYTNNQIVLTLPKP